MDGAISALLPTILKCAVPADDMSILISSTELGEYNRERIALLNIAKKVRQHELESLFKKTDEEVIEQLGRFHPALYCQIENYVRNFDWVPVSHHVQPLNLNLAIAGVRKTFSDNNFSVELKNLLNGPGEISRARQKLLKKYKFSRAELNILEYLRGINISNDGRKAAMSRAILWSYPLFQAIADRVGMDVISLRQLNYRQMGDYLMNEKSRPRLKKVINERFGYYYCLLSRGKIVDGSGDKARKFVDKFLGLGHEEVKEVKGAVAYRGKVKGRVRVIKMEYQAQNLLEGEILVSSMTDPDMVPAMKRAAAIVTDEGGLICHAAIVAREMKKPCVIATKIATKIFKDGDMVEVDAEKGIVRKI
ncbi:hypothetical protein EPN28_01675 [Patescibacteria group bacterium]|nr:MAG: hypothetical protein EPN28_01675 [Patescibacteria group bacterium]